jgi:1-aminocyclopropane-1-carboxylate deaminase/D-cysteine desulfhydrase-like pyridoxal-dependent ACC family enzyme
MMKTTPIEVHNVKGAPVYVKREDLCTDPPYPNFSKVRGLNRYVEKIKSRYSVIGYVETSISMAGWGVAYVAREHGLRAVIFDPQYTRKPGGVDDHLSVLDAHRKRWIELGAEIVPIKAGMARVNWNIARVKIRQLYPNALTLLLPLGLPLDETVEETRSEYHRAVLQLGFRPRTCVVCVGSGTIAAGILSSASQQTRIVGVMSRTGDRSIKLKKIQSKAGLFAGGLWKTPEFDLIDPGYEYTQRARIPAAPFPCHPWYDLKTWEWLVEHISSLQPPILFWNIGGDQCKV